MPLSMITGLIYLKYWFFYFYYVLIDNVFPHSWSVIIKNYILFNWGQISPRFLYHQLLFLSTKVKVLKRNGFLELFASPITYALVIYKSTKELKTLLIHLDRVENINEILHGLPKYQLVGDEIRSWLLFNRPMPKALCCLLIVSCL